MQSKHNIVPPIQRYLTKPLLPYLNIKCTFLTLVHDNMVALLYFIYVYLHHAISEHYQQRELG